MKAYNTLVTFFVITALCAMYFLLSGKEKKPFDRTAYIATEVERVKAEPRENPLENYKAQAGCEVVAVTEVPDASLVQVQILRLGDMAVYSAFSAKASNLKVGDKVKTTAMSYKLHNGGPHQTTVLFVIPARQ